MTTPSPETWTNSVESFQDALMRSQRLGLKEELVAGLPDRDVVELLGRFDAFAHKHQVAPPGDWTTWLLIGGRGAGKTRAGAEWIKRAAHAPREEGEGERRIALIGETEHETREVMIEGVSGILAVHAPDKRPLWTPSRRRLEWDNGTVAHAFSAKDPESLRGPQFSAAWADELAKWRHAQATFDMLQFGLRLGARPRQVTAPRSCA